MNIILEGTDCSGKSTFAQMLSEKTDYEVIQGSSFKISNLGADGMFEYTMELLERKDVIIDRIFYSNLVYGKLFNYPMMTTKQYDKLVNKLNRNSLFIYLHAPISVLKSRMEKRGDDMIKVENIGDILNSYKEVLHGAFRPKMMFSLDTSLSDFNTTTSMIKEIIRLEETGIYIKNS